MTIPCLASLQVYGTIPTSAVGSLVAALHAKGTPLAGPVTYVPESGVSETLNITVSGLMPTSGASPLASIFLKGVVNVAVASCDPGV